MSRIGKQPIIIPKGVTASNDGKSFNVAGPKGKLSMSLAPLVDIKVEGGSVICSISDSKMTEARAKHGLIRSIVANMVEGVAHGFVKEMEINGVGYRANVKGKDLELALGFSHPVIYQIPEGITITVDKLTRLKIEGPDRRLVGQAAADIRRFRKPEPYKGKGIKYLNEVIKRKAGKAAASAS